MPDNVQLSTLKQAQEWITSIGCGSETHGPNCWRVTTPHAGIAKRVADAFKKAGIWIWPPMTDAPDNEKPNEGRVPVEPAIEKYPIGQVTRPKLDPKKEPDVIFTIDIGWEYVEVPGAEQKVAQLAHGKPKEMKIEVLEK